MSEHKSEFINPTPVELGQKSPNVEDRRNVAETLVTNIAMREALRKAQIDSLTSLFNRAAFDRRFPSAVSRALDSNKPLALLLVDLDKFKRINDDYGHAAGDNALKMVGTEINNTIRHPFDEGFRLGGDELGVLMSDFGVNQPELSQGELIDDVTNRISGSLNAAIHAEGYDFAGASVGLAILRPGDTPESLYQRADAAMYANKRERNGGDAR